MKLHEELRNRLTEGWQHSLRLILKGLEDGDVLCSSINGLFSDPDAEMLDRIKKIEKKYHSKVWHVMKGNYKMSDDTEFEFIDFLLIGEPDPELSDEDNMVIDQYGNCFCYTVGICSELGYVDILPMNGGLRRRLPND